MSATRSGATSTYAYDPSGRRTSKTVFGSTSSYVYDGDAGIADYDPSSAVSRRFVPEPETDTYIAVVSASGAVKFFRASKMGSVIAMSDTADTGSRGLTSTTPTATASAAGPRARPASPSATPASASIPRPGSMTTARYYQFGIGRFLQTDPIGYKDDLDAYTYVGDDPTDGSDPSGMDTTVIFDEDPHAGYNFLTGYTHTALYMDHGSPEGGALLYDPGGSYGDNGVYGKDSHGNTLWGEPRGSGGWFSDKWASLEGFRIFAVNGDIVQLTVTIATSEK